VEQKSGREAAAEHENVPMVFNWRSMELNGQPGVPPVASKKYNDNNRNR